MPYLSSNVCCYLLALLDNFINIGPPLRCLFAVNLPVQIFKAQLRIYHDGIRIAVHNLITFILRNEYSVLQFASALIWDRRGYLGAEEPPSPVTERTVH